ncbi:MAG: FtsX-like permease family protein [Dehalococcoidia bacterium]|nr:FtsX-like permease family protein [Dehalococcoidia bacterium]
MQRGLYLGSNALPISGIASSQLLGQLGAGVGSTIYLRIGDVLVPVRISGEYDLFPTLPTSSGPSLVVNRDQLISWSNAFNLSGGQQLQANEVWVDIEPGATAEGARQQLGGPPFHIARFSDRAAEIEDIESNPLIAAGGSGILQLSFFAVLVLVGAALLLSLWMAVQRRRVEFAVLRAMGLSRGQVLRQLALEYAIVGVIGMAAGVYLGTLVGRRMLSFLDVTASGERVEPGFILQTDWSIVAISLAAVGVIFIVGLAFAVRALSRTSDAQALRTE